MTISAIVAMNDQRIIGLNNQIPWYLPADLKFFKKTTTGHHVLMGRKCYESIGKPLPNRTNIIITRDPYYIVSGCLIAHSVEEGIFLAKQNQEKELFIIGGGEVYNQSIPYWNKLYLTLVDYHGAGDTYFPEIEWENWNQIFLEEHPADAHNKMSYRFKIFNLQ